MNGATAPSQSVSPATSYPILSTKIFIPTLQKGIVPRPRLTGRLQQGLNRKLTLISAPPGFGKTTLVAEWRATGTPEAQRLAWVTLDKGDNDPGRFLHYVIRAIQTVEPEAGSRALSLIQSAMSRDPTYALASLINDLGTLSAPLIIALDDYHVITSESVHAMVTFLLEHMPANLHLIITSRHDPPLPLPRLRASRELVEFRADTLRFTVEEATAFLNEVMGLDLTSEQIASIESRTEGWIAGLLLAALSTADPRNRGEPLDAFSGDHRYIFDYLAEEVLRRQPPEIQQFLMRTSVLGRMNGEVADAVAGCDSGQAILEWLTRSNLFTIPLDYSRSWYRYHHLFGEFLSARFRQIDPEGWIDAHRRACDWFHAAGHLHDAIDHAIAAGDRSRLVSLIEEGGRRLVASGQIYTLMHWLTSAGEAACRERPRLALLSAWAYMFDRRFDEAERWLRLIDSSTVDTSHDVTFRADYALCKATFARFCGSPETIIETSEWAIEQLRLTGAPDDTPNRGVLQLHLGSGYRYAGQTGRAVDILTRAAERNRKNDNRVAYLNAMSELAAACWNLGRFRDSEAIAREALAFEDENGLRPIAMTSSALLALADIHRERNDLDEAEKIASTAFELLEDERSRSPATPSGRSPHVEASSEVIRAQMTLYDIATRIALGRGDLEAAMAVAREAVMQGRRLSLSPTEMMAADALMALVHLAAGDPEAAASCARQYGVDIEDQFCFITEPAYLTYATALIYQGRHHEATRLLTRLRKSLERSGRLPRLIQADLLQCVLLDAAGQCEPALDMLAGVIRRAEPEGYLRVYLDTHPKVPILVSEVGARNRLSDLEEYIGSILNAAGIDQRPATPRADVTQDLPDPLTEREIEVLQLLATGLSNREIADRIFVTVGTIKRHTYNIYGKLGAHNRTQAVIRGRELGLIE